MHTVQDFPFKKIAAESGPQWSGPRPDRSRHRSITLSKANLFEVCDRCRLNIASRRDGLIIGRRFSAVTDDSLFVLKCRR